LTTTETGAKIGQTTWQATVYFDDGDVPECVGYAEYPERSLGLAKTWAARRVLAEEAKDRPVSPAAGEGAVGCCYAELKRGVYRDESFTDPEYGRVIDGTWEADRAPGSHLSGSVARDGAVKWYRQ
jgi:hypothetical protein